MRHLVVLLAIVLGPGPALAQDLKVWTVLNTSDIGHVLAYSTCPLEKCFGDAITHIIGCSANGDDAFFEMAASEDSLKIVNSVAGREADSPAITLAIGDRRTASTVHQMKLSHNPMDGGWIVEFLGYEFPDLFRAIADGDLSQPVTITVEDATFAMNPSPADGEKLKALAVLCAPKE